MAKKNIKKVDKEAKIDIESKDLPDSVKQAIIITIFVLLFLGLFYLITVLILDDGTSSKKNNNDTVEVQHKEVLVGTSFSISDSEYYVLYYKTDDDEINSDLASLVSNYRSSNKDPYLYTVDMSNALNSAFNSDSSNSLATKASELKISGPTLIKFVDGKISQYIEGIETIAETLK